MEKWKAIKGFSDYEVSDLGRVRRATFGNNSAPAGKLLAPSTDEKGYKRVCLYPKSRKGRNGFNRLVHRLVALAFIPNPYNLPEVNHVGTTTDNRSTKLEWRSKVGNMQHATKNEKFGKSAGVYFEKRRCHWVARLWSGGRHKHGGHHTYIGSFLTKREALSARRAAIKSLQEVL